MQQDVRSHTFANGLTLLAERMPHVRSAAVSFMVPAGCAFDPPEAPGLASILADLLLRGAGERDSRELTIALDNLGFDHGESVRGLNLSLGGATLARNLPAVLDIYADILLRPTLPEAELEPAKMLALQDLQGLEDSPQQKVMIELRRRYYPEPINKDHFGTEAGINAVTIEGIREHFRKHVRPDGAIISVAGNVEWEPLREQIDNLFGGWKGDGVLPRDFGPSNPIREHIDKETEQTQIALAWPSVPLSDEGYYAARGAEGILSGGMGARLFTEVREKRGLCYSVSASYEALRDRGTMLAYAGTRTDRAQETLDVMLAELRRLGDGITEEELDRAKAGLKSSLIMRQESSSARAAALAADWYHLGRVRQTDEIQSAIDVLTTEHVAEHVRAYPAKNIAVMTLGAAALTLSEKSENHGSHGSHG